MRAAAMPILTAVSAILSLLAGGAAHARGEWPEFVHPPQSTVRMVTDDMVFNGVPMRILTFTSRMTVAEITRFYQRRWKRRNVPDPKVSHFGEWTIVGMIDGDFHMTAQVRKDGKGSMGHLGITKIFGVPHKKRLVLAEGVPMPDGSEVMNDMISRDPPKTARTVAITNTLSLDENVVYYLKQYGMDGWSVVQRRAIKEPGPGAALVFKKGTAETSVVLTKKFDKTIVFINTVTLEN